MSLCLTKDAYKNDSKAESMGTTTIPNYPFTF
ncbi:hypothetical protein Bhyg_14477 [Pseudolycoriella hygida]|uniref:Uncharacterized protein n=1 Tax=Pseudolycoriella hygida TaxID=35572 RepID=A0A9Q0RXB7_9DIPT|nr:hypothetical protein Bhyg_14477 [Pseudolycoriella hygida]